MLQCASKGREVEECKLVNMDVNIAGFKILGFKSFMRKEILLDTFVRAKGYIKLLFVYKRTPCLEDFCFQFAHSRLGLINQAF